MSSNNPPQDQTQADQTHQEKITQLEMRMFQLKAELAQLRAATPATPVADYRFATLDGERSLLDLFGDQDKLLVIHNMGQGCRYCTLWGDGFNGLLPHLESAMSVVLVSKDAPSLQRTFANSRGWKFRTASHGGGRYIQEQTVQPGANNMPGAVMYEREGDQVRRKNSCIFGPGDEFCSAWDLLGLAGLSEAQWMPQFNYWVRPEALEDGGENVLG